MVNSLRITVISLVSAISVSAINPIITQGRQFIDSVTQQPFYIRGVDYQPGGSSGYFGRTDPLSDVDACTRDVLMFQKLGLNAIRVYTVNPELNHDECMTLLASVGIYLILDVNSPRVGESLNRYEPWTTYNVEYFEHILKVVHQFSGFNNTLGFFAGNEIINDDISANASPVFIKGVIRDMKKYMISNGLRNVPIGYSAADDLRFRVPLAKYLECGDKLSSVDFYGVNSYQWCGQQTFTSSGYDTLVSDYKNYSLPLFLSEYGCNAITPRMFQEVEALYSPSMKVVFSGGLVYEYSQGPNNYGLVEIGPRGEAYLRQDYENLRLRMEALSDQSTVVKPEELTRPETCAEKYDWLNTDLPLPETIATAFILGGVPNATIGSFVANISRNSTSFQIFDHTGFEITEKTIIVGSKDATSASKSTVTRAEYTSLPAVARTGTVGNPAVQRANGKRIMPSSLKSSTTSVLASLGISTQELIMSRWLVVAIVLLLGSFWALR